MKIIVTGANGYIGSAIVRLALADTGIKHIYTLTRRPMSPELAQNKKVTEIVHDNFLEYPESLMKRLRGCDACLWTIGTPHPVPGLSPRTVDTGYTTAFLQAYTAKFTPNEVSKPLTFIYTSAFLSERNPSATLWLRPEARLSRGAAEIALLDFAAQSNGAVDVHIVKPALVTSKGWATPRREGWFWTIHVDVLARAMLRVATGEAGEWSEARGMADGKGKKVWENGEMVVLGAE